MSMPSPLEATILVFDICKTKAAMSCFDNLLPRRAVSNLHSPQQVVRMEPCLRVLFLYIVYIYSS